MKKNISSLFIITLFTLLSLTMHSCSKSSEEVKIKLNKKVYTFELADTHEKRKTGLMFRKKLKKDSGMLFVYSAEKILHFYMKDTFIPLDIAFINSNNTIVDIRQMKPLDETTVSSAAPALYALEANEGFFESIGVKVGDQIEIKTPIQYRNE